MKIVSGEYFADSEHDLVSIDKHQDKINRFHAKVLLMYRLSLDALVESNIWEECKPLTTDLVEGITGANAIRIAIGTFGCCGDSYADLNAKTRYLARELQMVAPKTVLQGKISDAGPKSRPLGHTHGAQTLCSWG